MTFLWHFRLAWHISAKSRNKKMHSLNGNGPPKTSEGKGQKGKNRSAPKGGQQPAATASASSTTESDDLDLTQQIQSALPQAAVLRSQSTLDSTEWSVPTVSPQLLDHRGGIALTPRRMIPEILRKVGFTTVPTAILTSQPAQDLGMKGFPQQQVRCALLVVNDEGSRDRIEVSRWLIQISYGQPVTQILQGRKVDIFTSMQFHIAKFPSRFGWPEKVPANLVATELQKHVPQDAFSEIVCRESKTASFLLHNDYSEVILKASGQCGVFYKLKKPTSEEDETEMPLLWLDESIELDTALSLAEEPNVLGVVEKGSTVAARYALRFRSLKSLEEFAKTRSIDPSSALMGRWKLTGLPAQVGIAGAFAFLQTQKWTNTDIIFLTDNSLIFLSDSVGVTEPMHCQFNGVARQLKFKATNAKGRQMMKDTNKASAASVTPVIATPNARAQERREFLQKVAPKATSPPSPRYGEKDKRPAAKSGETPDGKRREAGH